MLGPDGPTGPTGPRGATGATGDIGITGNTGPLGAYVLFIDPNTSVESFLITRGTTLAFTGAPTNSTPDVIETNKYIQVTTKKIHNNRGGYRNEIPFQDGSAVVQPTIIYLNNTEKAEFDASIQVVTFDTEQWSRNQCIVGFYRAHSTAANVSSNPAGYIGTSPRIGRTNVECLIGFRPSNTGKWKACIVLEDVFLNTSSESVRYDRELWKIETNFSIYDINTLKVIVFNGTRAEFYINEQFIGEVSSTDLIFNVGAEHPVGGIDSGSGYSVPYLVHTHPVGGPYAAPYGPQPIFAGAEIRQFHTNQATSIITESTDPSVQNMSIKIYRMSCKLTNDDKQNNIAINLSDGSIIGITGNFRGDTQYQNTLEPESIGSGIEILGSSSEGQLNIKGISGVGSLVVTTTDNNLLIDTTYISTVGNLYSLGLSADTLMYLKGSNLASSTRVKLDGIGNMNFQNQFFLNDSAYTKRVGPVKKNQYVGVNGELENFTTGTTGGIYVDLENGGFYVLQTPIGIAGFTGSFKQNEIVTASLLFSSDDIWKFPENVYFEENENYFTCGKSIVNLFSFDAGNNWYAVVSQRGIDLTYTNRDTFANIESCVPALSTGSCCYTKYPENTLNCLDYSTKDQCDLLSGKFSPLVSCVDSCGTALGLCCSNGQCIENVSVEECSFFGGNFYSGIACGTYPNNSSGKNYESVITEGRLCFDPCETEKLSCCKDGKCIGDQLSRIQCELILNGRSFTGGDCSTINCCEKNIGRGACCACAAKDLLCFDDLTPAECKSAEYDGIFMGEEERCENVNCRCVGGTDNPPVNNPPDFNLVLVTPTVLPNGTATINILNASDPENDTLTYRVIVNKLQPSTTEVYRTEFVPLTNLQLTSYTTQALQQFGAETTGYEIIVSLKDTTDNITTKSVSLTIQTENPVIESLTEFPDVIILQSLPTTIERTITAVAYDPDGGNVTYQFEVLTNTGNSQTTITTLTESSVKLSVDAPSTEVNSFFITVKCTVTDDEGQTSTRNTVLAFTRDLLPTFTLTVTPASGNVGTSFTAEAQIDANQGNLKYKWDTIYPDSSITSTVYEDLPPLSDVANIQKIIPSTMVGTYRVKFTLQQDPFDTFNTVTKEVSFIVTNNNPVITSQTPNETITLNATEAVNITRTLSITATDDEPLSYNWTVISGTVNSITNPTASSITVNLTNIGTYQFRCTVTDPSGATAQTTISIIINRSGAPIITTISSDFTVNPDTNFTIFASGVFDPENDALQRKWVLTKDTLDGTIDTELPYFQLTSPNTSFTVGGGRPGGLTDKIYYATLYIKDSLGNETSKSTKITVVSQIPTISALYSPTIDAPIYRFTTDPTSRNLLSNFILNCNLTATDPDGGSIVSYSTTCSASAGFVITNGNSSTPTLTFSRTGTFNLSHYSIDNEGQQSTVLNKTLQIVRNELPVIDTTQTQTSIAASCSELINGKNITIVANISDDLTPVNQLTTQIQFDPTQSTPGLDAQFVSTSKVNNTVTSIFKITSAGTYVFKVLVTELGSANTSDSTISQVATKDVSISVTETINNPPVITNPTSINFSNPLPATIGPFIFSAADSDGISNMLFVLGSILPSGYFRLPVTSFNSANNTFSISLNTVATKTAADFVSVTGGFSFKVRATDICGAFTDSTYRFYVVNTGPTVQITSPSNPTSLTLPITSQSITAVATDPEQSTFTYNWSLSGPSTTYTFTPNNSTSGTTILSGLNKGGTHVVTVSVTDNSGSTSTSTLTLNVTDPNPIANAGNDQTQTYAANTSWPKQFNLTGSGTDQSGGSISAYSWRIITNPGNAASLVSPTSQNTAVSISTFGTYTFGLIVTDNNGNTSSEDTVQIQLISDAPPTVTLAISTNNITLPTNSVTLTATTSSDVTSLDIIETNGNGGYTVTPVSNGPISWTRTISGLIPDTNGTPRTYSFVAKAYDVYQDITSNSVNVVVNNQAPTAVVYIPAESSSISDVNFNNPYIFGITGFANDPDGGSLVSPIFTCDAVPSTYTGSITFTNPTISSTSIAGTTYSSTCTLGARLVPGAQGYTFSFKITDNEGQTVTSPQKQFKFSNTGPVISFTTKSLVQNFDGVSTLFNTNLYGVSATDINSPSGPLTYTWTNTSSPAGAGTPNIVSPSTFTGITDIAFTNPQLGGTYQFRLQVADPDGSSTISSGYTIKRNAAPTVSITSPASDGTSITLPIKTVSLDSSASDSDGFISTYAWTITAKPVGSIASLSSTSVSNPTLTVDLAGSYIVQLIVTDNNGRQSTAVTRQITVNANPAPIISTFTGTTPVDITGTNQTASTTLTVSASDPNSQPLTYTFSQTSPATPLATIVPGSGTSANTATVSGMTVPSSSSLTPSSRTYEFKVDVSDGTNTASTTTNVVVNSSSPTITALNNVSSTYTGSSQLVTIGSGASVADPDGGSVTTQWSYVSGSGATPTINSSTSLSTNVTGFSVAGTYTFRLRVTDNEGTFTEKDITVTLNAAVTPSVAFIASSIGAFVVANGTSTYTGFNVRISNASTSNPCNLAFSISPPGPTFANPTYSAITNSVTSYSTGTISNLIAGTVYTISATATNPITSASGSTPTNPTLRRNALPSTPLPSGPATGSSGTKLTYTITGGSATDSDGSIANYTWSTTPATSTIFPNTTSTATTVGITFNADAVYTINYTATDNNSGQSTSGNFTTTISTAVDACTLKNYARSGALQAYNLIIPNDIIAGSSKNSTTSCLSSEALYTKFSSGATDFFDYLGTKGTAISWKINPTPPTGSDATGTKWPYSNFVLRRGNIITQSPTPPDMLINPVGGWDSSDYHLLFRSNANKVARPFDLSFASIADISTGTTNYTFPNFINRVLYYTRFTQFMSEDFHIGAGGDSTLDLANGIPFIFKCSCWDNTTDTLVYTNWYNYVNQTGIQEFNLTCPSGSTRQPRSLIVVRYRQPTALNTAVTNNTVGNNIINSAKCHSLDPLGAAVITTDITAYYVSIDNTVSRVGVDTCKLGIGKYRLMKYELNFPANLTNDTNDDLTVTNCQSNDYPNTGTCFGASNRYMPVASGTVDYQSLYDANISYDRITNIPETCNNCSVNTTLPSGRLKERTWANRNEPTKLGLVPNTAWQPPEFICVADCENVNYQTSPGSGVCISTMTGLCTPPNLNFAPDGVPPITNSSGNDNLVYIKIYNTEDPTRYECVPVLYNPDLIKQYELCES